MRAWVILLFASFLIGGELHATTIWECLQIFQAPQGHLFEIHPLNYNGINSQAIKIINDGTGATRLTTDVLADERAIYIGISHHAHTYVTTLNQRFSGGILTQTALHNARLLYDGIIIKLQDPSGKLVERIISVMAEHRGKYRVTCAAASCSLLRETEVLAQDIGLIRDYLPSNFLDHLLTQNFSFEGRTLKKEVFFSGHKTIELAIEELRQTSDELLMENALPAGVISGIVLAAIILDELGE